MSMWAYVAAAVATQVYSYIQSNEAAAKRNSYLETAAQNAEAAGKENRKIYENNARLAAADAATEKALGERRGTAELAKGKIELGTDKVILGQAGVDLLNAPEGSSAMDLFQQVAQDYKSKSEYEEWKGDYASYLKLEEAKSYNKKGMLAEWEGNNQAFGLRSSKQAGQSLTSLALGIGTTVAGGYYMAGQGGGMFGTDVFTKQSVSSSGQLGPVTKF